MLVSEGKAFSLFSMATQESTLLSGVAPIFMKFVATLLPLFPHNQKPSWQYLLAALRTSSSATIPDILNETFHNVDRQLSRLCEESDGKIHSGCTVVTAFLRIEEEDGRQSFLPTPPPSPPFPTESGSRSGSESPTEPADESSKEIDKKSKSKSPTSTSRFTRALKSLSGSSPTSSSGRATLSSPSSPTLAQVQTHPIDPPPNTQRVLYTANAGDARGVLCRAGRAVRLTYDHKGSDKQEAKRITDAGGFVMSGRVNGILAVTRSLGDSSMKEYVVGSPYTTETRLGSEDEFLILACDGVSGVV